ncbi:MAG: single-stranded-DNA-specific exonuclease RecJ, partial [Ruminococcaceae bacterium]|nr:single-stranded-DNA-specific exonuclease RecJ [Oscillospiraceae bacterium]
VTSVAVLHRYLYDRGVDVSYYIPSRDGEGYGMNADAIRKLAENGIDLIVSVDTGVTAVSEARLAKELGMDVVITDHHTCLGELPAAVAVVNPTRFDSQYPFTRLAGVGVAYKLVCALEMQRCEAADIDGCSDDVLTRYGDLVTLGTVADVMPLIDENRYIVKKGLAMASCTRNCGLAALVDTVLEGKDNRSGKRRNVTGQMIGYNLAPKINAAGRMARADLAEELFLTRSETDAIEISKQLCELNKQRQAIENEIVSLAVTQIHEMGLEEDPVLVLGDDGWHAGVIGIAASRISERFGKPTVLVSFEGEEGKGSMRSVGGFDCMKAFAYAEDLLTKYGGHTFAAGLSLRREDFSDFRKRLCEFAAIHYPGVSQESTVEEIDAELQVNDISLPTASAIAELAPFGDGNRVPLLLLADAEIESMIPLSGGKHMRLVLKKEEIRVSAVVFGVGPHLCKAQVSDHVDVIVNLEINEYGYSRSVQLMVKKLYLSGVAADKAERDQSRYRCIMQGEDEPDDVPVRADFAAVYRFLTHCALQGMAEMSFRYAMTACAIGYVKLRLILDIFKQTGLIKYRENAAAQTFRFSSEPVKEKVNIESCALYRRLCAGYGD